MSTIFESLLSTGEESHDNATRILLTTVPEAEFVRLLPAFYLSSDKPENTSDHQWATMKCRNIIFSDKEHGIIATPELGGPNYIYIICHIWLYDHGDMKEILKENNLHVTAAQPVTKHVYEACLRYTIIAKIAPLWNQVGSYLVHGRDFLTKTKALDAVRLDLVLNKFELQIMIWPMRIKLFPMQKNNIAMSSINLVQVNKPESDHYKLTNISSVYVLPSLKVGEAGLLSTKLPEHSFFNSYNDVRRYWKNSHGYRLPESSDSENSTYYLAVRFGPNLQWLSYPLICLQSHPPLILKVRNETGVLRQFLTDLLDRLPTLCSFPFGRNCEIAVAAQKLVNSTVVEQVTDGPTLPTRKRYTRRSRPPGISRRPFTRKNTVHGIRSRKSRATPVTRRKNKENR